MNLKISKLKIKLNELYKKIKNINLIKKNNENSQKNNLFSEINELKEDFSSVYNYVSEINLSFNNHKTECQKIPTQLETIQTNINLINEKINSIPNLNEYNFEEVVLNLNELILTTNELLANIESTKGGSDKSLPQLKRELDYENIVTKKNLQDNVQSLNSLTSAVYEQIGLTQSEINNLNETQTTQSQTQNQLTDSVSQINSRLLTAEKNVSALTGGVDVGDLDQRITILEENTPQELPTMVCANNYPMFLNLTSSTPLHSLYYYYKIDELTHIKQKFKINYTSNAQGTLTIKLLQNSIQVKEFVVDLTKFPSSYEINYSHLPTDNYQNFQFLFSTTSTQTIYFDSIDATIIGTGIQLFETDKDLKAVCFDNTVYLCRYYNHELKAGMIPMDELSLAPEIIPTIKYSYVNNAHTCAYGPTLLQNSSGYLSVTRATMRMHNASNFKSHSLEIFNDTGSEVPKTTSSQIPYSLVDNLNTYFYGACTFIYNGAPAFMKAGTNSTTINIIKNLESYKTGKWYFAIILVDNNYINLQTKCRDFKNIHILAYNQDGYLYLLQNNPVTKITKIARGGKFATGYFQTDGSINVYINKNNYTNKYSLTLDSNNDYVSTFVEKIENCDRYYELINNISILNKNNQWIISSNNE